MFLLLFPLFLLSVSLSIPSWNSDGRVHPLHFAVSQRRIDFVQQILDADVNVNVRDADGMTAIMLAAMSGQDEVVGMLLMKGADVNLMKNDGFGLVAISLTSPFPELKCFGRICATRRLEPAIIKRGRKQLMPATSGHGSSVNPALWKLGKLALTVLDTLDEDGPDAWCTTCFTVSGSLMVCPRCRYTWALPSHPARTLPATRIPSTKPTDFPLWCVARGKEGGSSSNVVPCRDENGGRLRITVSTIAFLSPPRFMSQAKRILLRCLSKVGLEGRAQTWLRTPGRAAH